MRTLMKGLFLLAFAAGLAACNRHDDDNGSPLLGGGSTTDTTSSLSGVSQALIPALVRSSLSSALQTVPLLQNTTGAASVDTTLAVASGTVRVTGTTGVTASTVTAGARAADVALTADVQNLQLLPAGSTAPHTVSGQQVVTGRLTLPGTPNTVGTGRAGKTGVTDDGPHNPDNPNPLDPLGDNNGVTDIPDDTGGSGGSGDTGGTGDAGGTAGQISGQLQETGTLTISGPAVSGQFPVNIVITVSADTVRWSGTVGEEPIAGSMPARLVAPGVF